jgi:hypothetical protein
MRYSSSTGRTSVSLEALTGLDMARTSRQNSINLMGLRDLITGCSFDFDGVRFAQAFFRLTESELIAKIMEVDLSAPIRNVLFFPR